MEERRNVVSILLTLSYMQPENSCNSLIAIKIELSRVLKLFHAGNGCVSGISVKFFLELFR